MSTDVFLVIEDMDENHNYLDGYTYTNGIHAVMRRFEKTPKRLKNTNSTFVRRGKLLEKLMLFETSIILSDIAVVPELDRNKRPTCHWLVVSNRRSWLDCFEKPNSKLRRVSKESLMQQSTLLSSEDGDSDDRQDNSQCSSDEVSSQDSSGEITSDEDNSDGTSQGSNEVDSQESSDDDRQISTDSSNSIGSYCSSKSSRDSSAGSNNSSK